MFGQQRAPFGSTTSTFGTGFGTPSTTTGTTGFGSTTFGRPAFGNTQQTTSFGASTTPFGAAPSSSTSLFGTQPQQTSGGLFGQQQPTQTSTSFSQPSTGFGTSGGGLFGQTQQPTSTGLFGSTTTGAFGAQQSTQNRPFGFGQTITSSTSTAGGLFSSTQPATGGGLFSTGVGFGGTGGVTGTTVKYEPVTGSDTMTRNGVSTSIRTKIEVISTMKEYENKSLEELRVEDYLANRKGPGQGTTMPGFGQTQQQATQPQLGGTGLFGSSSGTSLFSSTKPPENKTLFGSGTSTGFGTPTGGSLFGSSATTPAFGQTSTASNPSFSFNTQQQKATGFNFGNTATTTPSLFGSTPQQQQPSGFGLGGGFQLGQATQQQNTGGLFGNQNKPGGFLSNQNTSAGLFGNKPAGIAQPLSTGFGTTSAVTPFGQATNTGTGGGLFGAQNTQNKTGIFSGFNNNSSFGSTGLFGQNNNQQKPGGSLSFGQFGSTNTLGQTLGTNTGGGLFNPSGVNTNVGMTGAGLLNTNSAFGMPQLNLMGNAGGGIYPDLGKLVKAMTEKPIFDIPLGSQTSSSSDRTSSTSSSDQGSSKLPSSSLKPTYVLSPSLVSNKPRPKPINKANNQGNDRHWLFKGLEDPSEESSEDFLKPKKYPSVRKLNLKVFKGVKSDTASLGSTQGRAHSNSSNDGDSPSPLTTPISSLGDNSALRTSGSLSQENSSTPEIIKGRSKVKRLSLIDKHGQMNDTLADLNVNHLKVTEPADDLHEADDSVDHDKTDLNAEANKENNVSIFNSVDEEDIPEIINRSSDKPHPAGVKLMRSGYYTLPSLDDLGEMVDSEGRCLVENFTVGRYGYGNVCFLGVTDIAGLDLDTVVFILRKQIEVYPEGTQKPAQGQELNKPAVITLDCVWPIDKTTREVIKSAERLQSMSWGDYLERQCVKMEANFIEYRPETGSWVFKVKHFSKYGLQEDNEEEDMVTVPPKSNQMQPTPPQSGALTGSGAAIQLPSLPMHVSGPPVTMLTSPPQFGLGQMTMPSLASKQVSQPRYLDSPHQDIQVPDDEVMDSSIAKEPEESASLSVMSPSSERLTVLSRVVPRTVQLAKSQMFGVDDDEEPLPTTRESTPTPQGPRVSSKKLMLATDSPLNQSRGATMSPVPSEPKSRVVLHLQPLTMASPPKANVQTESCLAPLFRDSRCEYEMLPSGCDVGREVGHVPPQHQTTIVPFASSLMNGLDHCLSDMGAFMGRSFRVGWGPCWKLVHAGTPLASTTMEEYSDDASLAEAAITHPSPASFLFLGSLATHPKTAPSADSPRYNLMVEKLHTVHPHSHTIDHLTEASLECVLERSILDIDEMSESKDPKCPFFRPVKDIDLLHQLAETAASFGHEDPTISNIFNLCVALWGRLDFYSPESDGENDYSVSRARVEAVSQWLEAVSHATVQEEVAISLNKDDNEEGYLDAVFAHLTARQISEACVLAQDEGDHHLALLLAQACLGQDAPRQILAQQLANWAEGGTDALMASSRLALYALLAAAPIHQASHTTVNTCHGLDWRRAFALHLWYVCPATSTIMEALQEYEQAAGLRGDAPSYCEAPLPPYLAYQALPNGMKASYDICYHLLKLFTDPMHQLEALLNPATITPDPLDVTVSWLLWRILESLGYQHLSGQLSASLHLSMAALMESAGQWHWAIFVLLNINDEERRRKEVREILQRHVAVGEENEGDPKYAMREDFVITKLSIPKKWIHQAKATKARSLNMVDEEAWYLLKAGEYNRAHMLIVDTIAPNSIINEDHQYLHGFLDQLCDDGVRSTVVDWAIGGGVYADYLDVCSVVDDMKKSADPTPAMLEQLRPRLLALCSRLNNLKCRTATHRLCVSEMSRVVVGVLRAVVGEGTDATQVLSQQLSGLPLTHDYALTELNMVTTHYLTHLSAET